MNEFTVCGEYHLENETGYFKFNEFLIICRNYEQTLHRYVPSQKDVKADFHRRLNYNNEQTTERTILESMRT